jgi:glutamate-1-semialdehyde 2,1-aminomutase
MSTSLHPRSHNQDTALGPKSRAEFERSKAVTPGGSMRAATYFAPHPPYAASGSGPWVTDVDGRRIFDCANNFFSLIHGHAFPPVVAALHDVIDRGTAFGLPLSGESDLGEELRRRAPRLEQVRFVNSGTEAVMFAVKAARAITGRPAIAKIEGAYHGAYDHVEISLDPTPDSWGSDRPTSVPYAKGTPHAVAEDTLVLRFNEPQQCRELLQEHAHRLAAVLFDPLASRSGMVPASAAFCEALQESCRKHGILLIMDEVISFRLAHGGAHDAFGLEPDLVALAKIIGGGLPIGAIAGRAEVMQVFSAGQGRAPLPQGGTFAANPLSMVAGLAAMQALDRAAFDHLARLGDAVRTRLATAIRDRQAPFSVVGAASLFRLHPKRRVPREYRESHQSAAEAKVMLALWRFFQQAGVNLPNGAAACLSTPMGEAEVELIGTTFERFLDEKLDLFAELAP